MQNDGVKMEKMLTDHDYKVQKNIVKIEKDHFLCKVETLKNVIDIEQAVIHFCNKNSHVEIIHFHFSGKNEVIS